MSGDAADLRSDVPLSALTCVTRDFSLATSRGLRASIGMAGTGGTVDVDDRHPVLEWIDAA